MENEESQYKESKKEKRCQYVTGKGAFIEE
jgi:hypothetical protein